MNTNDNHLDRRPLAATMPVTEQCEVCGKDMLYGALNSDLECATCAAEPLLDLMCGHRAEETERTRPGPDARCHVCDRFVERVGWPAP